MSATTRSVTTRTTTTVAHDERPAGSEMSGVAPDPPLRCPGAEASPVAPSPASNTALLGGGESVVFASDPRGSSIAVETVVVGGLPAADTAVMNDDDDVEIVTAVAHHWRISLVGPVHAKPTW
jgi:hypothetical protein